jgi:hypothetical protein
MPDILQSTVSTKIQLQRVNTPFWAEVLQVVLFLEVFALLYRLPSSVVTLHALSFPSSLIWWLHECMVMSGNYEITDHPCIFSISCVCLDQISWALDIRRHILLTAVSFRTLHSVKISVSLITLHSVKISVCLITLHSVKISVSLITLHSVKISVSLITLHSVKISLSLITLRSVKISVSLITLHSVKMQSIIVWTVIAMKNLKPVWSSGNAFFTNVLLLSLIFKYSLSLAKLIV